MKEKFKLGNVALYAKGYYERSNDLWKDLEKCFWADGISLQHPETIVKTLINKCSCLFPHTTEELIIELVKDISPSGCWKIGYYTKDHLWCFKDLPEKKNEEYDYRKAIVYFFLSRLQLTNIKDLGGLPAAHEDVLPLANYKKESVRK